MSARSAAQQAPQSRTSRNIGPLIVLTDRRQATRPLADVVAAAVEGGARLVVLREKDLSFVERSELAATLHALLAAVGGRLLLAGDLPGPDGVHLSATDPMPPRPAGLVGRSCHTPADLARAAEVDYATISPVFASLSKPGYGPALGLHALGELCVASPVPVYALGGVDSPARARECVAAGAAGVAVMGAVMRATDPSGVVADLLAGMRQEVR